MTARLSYPDHKADLCGPTSVYYAWMGGVALANYPQKEKQVKPFRREAAPAVRDLGVN